MWEIFAYNKSYKGLIPRISEALTKLNNKNSIAQCITRRKKWTLSLLVKKMKSKAMRYHTIGKSTYQKFLK